MLLDAAIEIVTDPLVLIFLPAGLFFNLFYILLELIEELREFESKILIIFGQYRIHFTLFILVFFQLFHPRLDFFLDTQLSLQPFVFFLLESFEFFYDLVGDENGSQLAPGHLLYLKDARDLILVCLTRLIFLSKWLTRSFAPIFGLISILRPATTEDLLDGREVLFVMVGIEWQIEDIIHVKGNFCFFLLVFHCNKFRKLLLL